MDKKKKKCLNPFYIRSRIPTSLRTITFVVYNDMSQSLLHQVTYSDLPNFRPISFRPKCLNPFYIRSRIPTSGGDGYDDLGSVSQSLLHQVTYSDTVEHAAQPGNRQCLNPFYIRSRIPTSTTMTKKRKRDVSIPFTSGHVFRHLHRRSSLRRFGLVSIPFTSGHVFRPLLLSWGCAQKQMSQSLLHQVTYSDRRKGVYDQRISACLNPFYIRSRIPT